MLYLFGVETCFHTKSQANPGWQRCISSSQTPVDPSRCISSYKETFLGCILVFRSVMTHHCFCFSQTGLDADAEPMGFGATSQTKVLWQAVRGGSKKRVVVEGPIFLYETMLNWVVATQICFIFTPNFGEKNPCWLIFFKLGWNHQQGKDVAGNFESWGISPKEIELEEVFEWFPPSDWCWIHYGVVHVSHWP